MDLQSSSQDIIFFILFFIPGFIMLKFYGLLVARDKFDFSSGLYEAVAFSCINYAICSPLIFTIIKYDWLTYHFNLLLITVFMITLILPMVFVKLYVLILHSNWAASNKILDIHKSAWDFFFSRGEYKWVIVTLKNGMNIGGKYCKGSYASSYPQKDIYISEVWKFKENTLVFDKAVNRTCGILIFESEISHIEFFN